MEESRAALVRAKYVALQFLDNEQASGTDAVNGLLVGLREIAAETDIRHLPDYPPIHEGRLISSLDKIQDAKRILGYGDRLTIETVGTTYEVDLTKTWSPAKTLVVPDTRETSSEGEVILGIRKPDLLGEAMWQFSHGKVNNPRRRLATRSWLRKFHEREIALYSGDSMRCSSLVYLRLRRGRRSPRAEDRGDQGARNNPIGLVARRFSIQPDIMHTQLDPAPLRQASTPFRCGRFRRQKSSRENGGSSRS